jgi:oxygen-dependent protoporphyrinogen oxidase
VRVGIVGGGIAGLSAAYRLRSAHDVVLFEREAVTGGKIRSQQIDGYLFEWGPSGFLSTATELRTLVDEIGLGDALTPARPASKNRFIYWNGELHRLPAKPPEVLKLSLLSPLGKVRALRELFIPAGAGSDDESVYAFMARRFGGEVAERLVAPAVLGISGGDASTTSVAALFPRVREMEREHGSVIRALTKGPRRSGDLCSFAEGGMQTLTARLAERLGERVRLGVAVQRVEPHPEGWRIEHDGGETIVDTAIVATPSDVAATLLGDVDAELAAMLNEIPYAPMRVAGVAFWKDDVPMPLDGFGYLAAREQGVRSLGAFYTSSIVPEHAPKGTAYLRIFLGGATDPEIAALDSQAVRAIVLADLRTVLGITAAPVAYHEMLWPRAIPQYTLRHPAIVRAIETRTATHKGLALIGNAYRGLGVGDTVRDALTAAARLAAS